MLSTLSVEAVGALAGVEDCVRLVEPPCGPTQAFKRLWGLLAVEGIHERGPGGGPLSVGEPSPTR